MCLWYLCLYWLGGHFVQDKLAFTLDSETGLPIGCHIYDYKESNWCAKFCCVVKQCDTIVPFPLFFFLPLSPFSLFLLPSLSLIEEFMLLANMAVAHHISNAYPEVALLRRHPPPKDRSVDNLVGVAFN